MVNQFQGSKTKPPQFTGGYGLVFGKTERKAVAMSWLTAVGQRSSTSNPVRHPGRGVRSDALRQRGSIRLVQHLKLPHYVDFQSELELICRLRAEAEEETRQGGVEGGGGMNAESQPKPNSTIWATTSPILTNRRSG